MKWTLEAEELLRKAPLLLRPFIRRHVEKDARRCGVGIIDPGFVHGLHGERRGGNLVSGAQDATPIQDGGEARLDAVRGDVQFITNLFGLYCKSHHADHLRRPLRRRGKVGRAIAVGDSIVCCRECERLLFHAVAKRQTCPYHPKPACRMCETPCHDPAYRERIAAVMQWGMGNT